MSAALRVSVITPAYNAAPFIADAIASMRAQSRPPDEIIVVDDGSTDGTGAIAAGLGADIRVLRQPLNEGCAAARSRGILAATGDVIAWLDADDLWPPNSLSVLLARMEQPPRADIVAGRLTVIGEHMPARPPGIANDMLNGFAMCFGCAAIRRNVFDLVGLPNAELRIGSDADWFLRAREKNVPVAVVDDTTLIYRRNDASITRDIDKMMQAGMQMLKRSLDRRRADGKPAHSLPHWPIAPGDPKS